MISLFICLLFLSVLFSCTNETKENKTLIATKNESIYSKSKADYYSEMVSKYINSNSQLAIKYIDSLLITSQKIGYDFGVLKAKTMRANSYIYEGNPDSAIISINEILPEIKKSGSKYLLCTAYSTLGSAYNLNGSGNEAMDYHLKSLKLSEPEKQLANLTATTYLDLSRLFIRQRNYIEGIAHTNKAKDIFTELKDTNNNISCLVNLSGSMIYSGKYDSAIAISNEAFRLAKINDNRNKMAQSMVNMAICYAHNEDIKKSIEMYNNALKISANPAIVSGIYCNLISAMCETRDFRATEKTALEAIKHVDKYRFLEEKAFIYDLMCDMYSEQRKFEPALKYFKLSRKIIDSLASINNKAKFEELNLQYQTEKKEMIIDKLKSEKEAQMKVGRTLLFSVVVLIILIIALFYLFSKQKKISKAIKISNEQLTKANEEISFQKTILEKGDQELSNSNQQLIIANDTLTAMNKELEILDVERTELLGIAAHDLKNPLSTIKMTSETIRDNIEVLTNEDIKESVGDIITSVNNMMDLIINLLDMNRIENGSYNLQIEEINLNELLSASVYMNKICAEKKNIDLKLNIPEEPINVKYDYHIFKEITENYISNAIKFSPFNKSIYVNLERLPNNNIKMSVADEGQGISEADQKKLFTKYAKLSVKPTGGENSTGLGLSIVKKLADILDSEVKCESTLGKGSEFMLIIPAQKN